MWQSGWSSHSATLPEWLSGLCENFRHCAFNPKNANNKQTSSMPQNVVAEKNVMIQQRANHKIDNHRHEKNQLIKRWFQSHSAQVLFVGKVRLDQFGWRSCPTHPEPTPL
jgi:hypothetical protein